MGIGVQDASIVRSSLSNLAIAAGISILASALYFFVSPIHEASNELFARTQPTFLDVMVALFGGLAGILAGFTQREVQRGSRRGHCHRSDAAALHSRVWIGQWGVGFLARRILPLPDQHHVDCHRHRLVIRYLRFPVVHLVDTVTERKYKRWFTILLLALVIPSTYIFYSTVYHQH